MGKCAGVMKTGATEVQKERFNGPPNTMPNDAGS